MPKEIIQLKNTTTTNAAYSPGIRVNDFIFISGQGPIDADGKVVGETIEEQTRITLENVKAVLEAAGATLADVVKATVHLDDMSLFDRYNAVYKSYFPDPRPARTTVGSQLGDILVEIDVIAYIGQ